MVKTMLNLEEEINIWKYLLDAGKIDEMTYNKEIDNNIYTMNENSAVYGQELSW